MKARNSQRKNLNAMCRIRRKRKVSEYGILRNPEVNATMLDPLSTIFQSIRRADRIQFHRGDTQVRRNGNLRISKLDAMILNWHSALFRTIHRVGGIHVNRRHSTVHPGTGTTTLLGNGGLRVKYVDA